MVKSMLSKLVRPILPGNKALTTLSLCCNRPMSTTAERLKTVRLRDNRERKVKMAPSQKFDYFLILDFEATCDNKQKLIPQEIIEFPVLKVNGQNFQVESQFHEYVQPKIHKELTPFCTELTGIIQEMVDDRPHLEEVLAKFEVWMGDEGLLDEKIRSAFITCGDWDLKTMLPSQCRYFNLPVSGYFKKWINVKRSYSDVTSQWPKGMMPMLAGLNLKHQGRHHSGIDDCKNIANIVKELGERGYTFKITSHS